MQNEKEAWAKNRSGFGGEAASPARSAALLPTPAMPFIVRPDPPIGLEFIRILGYTKGTPFTLTYRK